MTATSLRANADGMASRRWLHGCDNHAEEATMPVPTLPDGPLRAVDPESPVEERIEARLARLEQRVERGNQDGRKAGRAFMLFAVGALMLALVNLIAVAAKLDGSSTPAATSKSAPAVSRPAAPAAGGAAPVVAARRVGVTLREYTVAPSATVGRAGRVTFAVRNAGAIPHEFVVLRTRKPAAGLIKGNEADEAGNVGEIGDLQPGQAKTVTLPLKPGHYALICNLPGHYNAGQHADFRVVR
jgi:uncharacterized cupredoxin-like copper-binding protein